MERDMEVPVVPAPAPVPVSATVGVAKAIGSELSIVKDLSGGNPIVSIILVLILVLGGKAGWSFWTKRQMLKTKLEEKRLELETKVKLAKIKAEDDDDKEDRKRKAKKD